MKFQVYILIINMTNSINAPTIERLLVLCSQSFFNQCPRDEFSTENFSINVPEMNSLRPLVVNVTK
jgi:hypothetical protein